MKLFKVTKKKVIAGVLGVSILASGGIAFAATDLGTLVQNWFNEKFNQSASSLEPELREYAQSKEGYIIQEGLTMLNTTNEQIWGTRDNAITSASGEIDAKVQSEIEALRAKEDEILNSIEGKFDWVKGIANDELDKLVAKYEPQAEGVLSSHAMTTGSEAIQKVEEDLALAQEEAVAEINAEIERVKNSINQALESERNATATELKEMVDQAIEDTKARLLVKLDGFIATQQELINNKALELQENAKSAIDQAIEDGFKE